MAATPRMPAHITNPTTSRVPIAMDRVADPVCPVASWTIRPRPVICSCRYGNKKANPITAATQPSTLLRYCPAKKSGWPT